jgi:DNA polymerase-3 subunit gamma/tau
VPEIDGKLRTILAAEGRVADDEAVTLIARLAAGGMRDAESMLDQLLGSAEGSIDADAVRDLLGLADDEAVRSFTRALAEGDARAGLAILDDLESHGRDLRTFLDQVVETLRSAITDELAGRPGPFDSDGLRSGARRLAAIDPARTGPGGVRFAIEVALLDGSVRSTDPSKTPELVADPVAEHPMVAEPAPAGTRSAAETATPVPSATPAPGSAPVSQRIPASDPPPTPEPGDPVPRVSTPDGAIDPALAELVAQWPEVVAHISAHPPTRPLISVCRPIAVDGAVVTLGFPEGMSFLADVAERRRSNLEEGIARFLGRPVVVRCVATNLELAEPQPAPTDGDRLLVEARRIFADDLAEVGEVD